MKTIWKYPIEITDKQVLMVPQYNETLAVGLDPSGTPCLWIELNSDEPEIPIEVYVVGTGNPVPEDAQLYVGSFLQGPFVWHVYTNWY